MIEYLGFHPEDRGVIINADDFGISYASNQAITELFLNESITSSSLMIPCEAAQDAAIFCKKYKQVDVGVHLTLTSSENHRYKPLSEFCFR